MRERKNRVGRPYPNQAPGSAYCDELDRRAIQNQEARNRPPVDSHKYSIDHTKEDDRHPLLRCAHCGDELEEWTYIWVFDSEKNTKVPKCKNGWGCRRNDAR